jgi:methylmalonyl-CoA/ethylmalonyl-CoA epimerase
MEIKFNDRIGVVVKSLSEVSKFYEDILQLYIRGKKTVAEQKAKVFSIPIKGSNIELLESTESNGPIAKFIDSNGEGIQTPID